LDFFDFKNGADKRGKCDLLIGDCLEILRGFVRDGIQFDAIVTDPPYEIGLHAKAWDQSGVAFSPELWGAFHALLKPGGFVLAFGASRLYHRLAVAGEDAGFKVHPFLHWEFTTGLPKPVNLSELFDRENVPSRPVIGEKRGSGFTSANVEHGAQKRSKTTFAIRERHVSDEAKAWKGFYYGLNCFKPVLEPIFCGQKAPSPDRMVDNVRRHGTGALNLGAVAARNGGGWPTTAFRHPKARKEEHGSDHPSVKPVSLMEDLCLLACPPGGRILDPFAGTGTTGVAATKQGLDCTLIERDRAMEPVIRRRVSTLSDGSSCP
jgi:DNA modification methylase